MADEPIDTVLLIADISGYTRFMLANRMAISHGQGIISDLLGAVIAASRLPLTVEKLEGDAVFLAAQRTPDLDWPAVCEAIGGQLPALVESFDAKLRLLAQDNVCNCPTCIHMHRLSLKVIGHVGTALRYRLGRFEELAGPDVITVHRLLKNNLASNRYLLLTETAFQTLRPAGAWTVSKEDLEGMGRQDIRWLPLQAAVEQVAIRRFSLTDHWRKMRYAMTGLIRKRPEPAA